MPGCVLRAVGVDFDVDAYLRTASFAAEAVFRKGRRRSRATVHTRSGFNAGVSDASGSDLAAQVRDAVGFLRAHRDALERLVATPGVEEVGLDFGLYDVATPERPWPSYRLDRELVALCGELSLEIELSFYGAEPSDE